MIRWREESGYTLVELLAALAIFTLVAVPLLSLLTVSAFSTARAGLETTAVELARDKMEEIKSEGYQVLLEAYREQGDYLEEEDPVEGFPRYTRVVEVEPSEESCEEEPSLLDIRVTVSWEADERVREVELLSSLGQR